MVAYNGPRTPAPKIIRVYCAGSMAFAKLILFGASTEKPGLCLKTDHCALPVESVEAADALVKKMLEAQPTTAMLQAPEPYENFGFSVSFRAVDVTVAYLPTPPPAPAPAAQAT